MEEDEPLDHFKQYPKGKGNQTIQMFVISVILIAVMSMMWLLDSLFTRVPDIVGILFGTCAVSAFGISVAGIYIGLSERKYSTNWVKTGLIGNIVIVMVPVSIVAYTVVEIIAYSFLW